MALTEAEELELLELEEQEARGNAPVELPPNDPSTGIVPAEQQAKFTPEQAFEYDKGGWDPRATSPEGQRMLENYSHVAEGAGMAALGGLGVQGAVAGMKGLANMKAMGGIRNSLAKWLEEKSLTQGWQALGGTKAAGKEIGEDASNALSKMARDEGIITPYASAKEMLARKEPLQKVAGENIGALRAEGDAMGAAPEIDDILAQADASYGKQFTRGIEKGSKNEFLRAKEQIGDLRPTTPKTIQEPALQQVPSSQPQQMELVDRGFPELFPQDPTEGTLRTIMNDIPNPAYPAARPGTSDIAQTVTDMNSFARSQNKMLRPSNATTKVADTASSMNDANLVQSLGAEKGQQYVNELDRFGQFQDMGQLLEGARAGEKVGAGNIPLSRFGFLSNAVESVAPATARTHWYHKLSQKLMSDPQAYGRNRETLMRAMKEGKSSLNSTIYILQQQSPEFKAEWEADNK